MSPLLRRLDPLLAAIRRRSRRELILIGTGAALLVAAVIVLATIRVEDPAPDDELVGFYCAPCDLYFELSGRELERILDKHAFKPAAGGRQLAVKCRNCGELRAERA
ncbi:MAG: hypothetical protein AB1716_08590, partial [Planctomycetota bacterium]